jgi:hypothetical protein
LPPVSFLDSFSTAEEVPTKKFLVLYESSRSAAEQMANATPEQAKAGMDAWMAWAGQAAPGIVDMGAPLGDSRLFTSPESGAGSRSAVTGYGILQAESAEALSGLLRGHPHFQAPGGSIRVFELLQLPGM